jgi:hypothetical protein
MRVFVDFLRTKLATITTDRHAMATLLGDMPAHLVADEHFSLRAPNTEDELWQAIKMGKKNKAPGPDGIPTDFYQLMWPTIKRNMLNVMNTVLTLDDLPPTMTDGVVVCTPKTPHPATTEEYRLLTLLNPDTRIFARVLANRMRPFLWEVLHPSQYGGGGGDNTILDALTVLRETVTMAEMGNAPMCIFKNTFDNIAHDYLFSVLARVGYGPTITGNIRKLYTNATSRMQLNGFIIQPVRVNGTIHQGCPLSTILFSTCLSPLLWSINAALQASRPPRHNNLPITVAYVYDVTVIL